MSPPDNPAPLGRGHWWQVGTIFLFSGSISLVYQVLWMKELGLLFGNTAQATSTTLTAFFLGLALGGWGAARIAPRIRNPLRAYGWLEILIAISALGYFFLYDLYVDIYPSLYQNWGHRPELLLLVKFVLGVGVLLPAAFFMGGTLPFLGQHVVRVRSGLGRGGSALYAINTLGAAGGAYLAGFHLPPLIGFNRTYLLAIAANLAIGAVALVLSARVSPPSPIGGAVVPDEADSSGALSTSRIRALAFLTGFVTLALEVLWTHMFAQVLHNSVYTFAIILITFLLALAGGSVVAHFLSRRERGSPMDLLGLFAGGGVLVAASPMLFSLLTDGLAYFGGTQGWIAYQARVFLLAAMVLFLPTLLIGTVFPYLLKLSEATFRSPGRTIGNLVAINTAAAILGSLLAGFLLLEWFGLWRSIRVVAAVTFLGVPLVMGGAGGKLRDLPWTPVWLVLLAASFVNIGHPPLVKVGENETILETWEGSAGVVAVIQNERGLRIKVDNHYGLGGSASKEYERRQGMIPLLLHPSPRDVFFLGMGTGITASAAMNRAVETITICELMPDAITAAMRYFHPFTDGLSGDPRVRILAEDGRTFLMATDLEFDVIVADLFVPWKVGVGSLYSREHFEAARNRLKPGGIMAQWVPLFQMSEREVAVVAKTMLEVFSLVTVWRGDLSATTPIVAFIGHTTDESLDPIAVKARLSETLEPALLIEREDPEQRVLSFLLGYCGNLSESRDLVADAPVDSDDRPRIEYLAPVTHRRVQSGEDSWLIGERLLEWLERLREATPGERDPYLARLTEQERGYADAGFLLHKSAIQKESGEERMALETELELDRLLDRLAGN